jgi:PAS domain S-box-containing protein
MRRRIGLSNTIQGKLLLLLFVTFISMLIIQAIFILDQFRTQRANELQANLEVARAVGGAFEQFVHNIIDQELAIGIHLSSAESLPVEEMNKILKQNAAVHTVLRNFSWVSPQGRVVASSMGSSIGMDIGDCPCIRNILSREDWSLGNLTLSRTTGEPIIPLCRGIGKEDGKLVGIVVAVIFPDRLDEILSIQRVEGGEWSIIDAEGRVVYRYPQDDGLSWAERSLLSGHPFLQEALHGKEVAGTVLSPDDKKRMTAVTPIESLGWAISAGRLQEEAMAPVRSRFIHQISMSLALTIVVFLAALVVSHSIAAPLNRLKEQVLALGRGDLKRRVEVKGYEELQKLASAFNTMAGEIEAREEALQAAQQRLLTALEAIPAFVHIQARDYSIRYANHIFRESFGDPDGKPCYEALRGRKTSCEECTALCVFDTQTPQKKEWSSPDGRHYIIYYHPFTDIDGSLLLLKMGVDITDHKQAEEKIRRYALMATHSRDIILFIRRNDGRIMEANTAAVNAYGYSREELLTLTIQDLREPSTVGVIADQMAEADAHDILFETVHRSKEGATFPVEVSSRGVTIGDDRILISVVRDITERKRAEANLRESEERLNLALAASRMGVWEWDVRTDAVFWSPECYDILGVKGIEATIESFMNLVHPEDLARIMAAANQALVERKDYQQAFRIIHPSGAVRWVNNLGRAEYDENGDALRLVGIVQDITERKKAEDELRSLPSRLLAAQEEERKRIAYELHDSIGGSLGAVQMGLQNALMDARSSANLTELLESLNATVQQAKDEARRIYANLRPSMLDDLGVIPTIEWFTRQFQEIYSGVRVEKQIRLEEEDIPEPLKIVIFRVMQESFHNISKYSKADRVSISLAEEEGSISLIIADNGVGFDVPSAYSMRGGKGGLGLTSMKERVELSGGVFAIESIIGTGTTVRASWNKSILIREERADLPGVAQL